MQYSPKLKEAANEIKAILNKYDIAGAVVLHTPGYGEWLFKIDASYSCAWVDPDKGQLRLKTTHLPTMEAKKKALEDTTNMLVIIDNLAKMLAENARHAVQLVNKKFDIENTGGDSTTHTQQNN